MEPNSPARARTSSPTPSPRAAPRVAPPTLDHAVARHRRDDHDHDATTTSSTTTTISTSLPRAAYVLRTRSHPRTTRGARCVTRRARARGWVLTRQVRVVACSDIRRLCSDIRRLRASTTSSRSTTTTTSTGVTPRARRATSWNDTRRGIITTTTITVTVTHATVDGEGEVKARVGI